MPAKLVDVEKVIASKNPRLLRILPGFVIGYLKRVLHQEEINTVLEENRDLYGADFADNIMDRYNVEVSVENIEEIPESGGVILACNHSLGGMDALAMVHIFNRRRKDIRFIVNDILLNLESLKGLFVGVNKHGANAMASLQQVNELFTSDQAVFVFPAGLVSRKIKGEVTDLEWKKTFVTRARKYDKPVIPVHVSGHLSNFFYRLANLRKWLGIKANIEMLYLAHEQFKLRNTKIHITVGRMIKPEEMKDSRSDREWTEEIRRRVYKLGQ